LAALILKIASQKCVVFGEKALSHYYGIHYSSTTRNILKGFLGVALRQE